MVTNKKKSAIAKKNEGNDLFFRVLHNILTDKSEELYYDHIEEPTFEDAYTNVGVEKALMKCYDIGVVRKLVSIQDGYSRITEKTQHYWYLLNSLPKTYKYIDWKNGL